MNEVIAALLVAMAVSAHGVDLELPDDILQASFAAQRIQEAGAGRSLPRVIMELDASLPEQGYEIRPTKGTLTIAGGDARGLMYGGLELAERIRLGQEVENMALAGSPFIKRRGLKQDHEGPSYPVAMPILGAGTCLAFLILHAVLAVLR